MPPHRRTLPLLLAALATAAVPATALAKHGDDDGGRDGRDGDRRELRVAGSCSDGSTAKLKVKHDDGRLETEFEVDQNRNGITWTVQVRRNGAVAISTRATTRGPSGSFSVERKIADGRGADRVTARATSPSGEVCTAATTF